MYLCRNFNRIMVKVSVILPVYNVASYLDEAFQSLIQQSLREIEIIAINDGATDNSQEYIDKYMALDPRIKCVKQVNQGLSGARNSGIRLIQGEYVYFMDSDDIIETDALETCYYYAKHNDADVCLFDAKLFYENNAKQVPWNYDRSKFLIENHKYQGKDLFNNLIDKEQHRAVVWLQFIKGDYLKKLNLTFFPGIIHEDELFTPQLLLQTENIYYLNKKFIKHRVRSSSIQGGAYSKRNINCYLTVIDELLKWQNTPIIQKFAKYTLSKVFYTGHQIPFKEKFGVFWRAVRSGYLKYIGWKSAFVFWFKRKN